jgi:hypothetical protein
MYKIFKQMGDETITEEVGEAQYREWLRSELRGKLSGRFLEEYINKQIEDIHRQKQKDLIRF